MKKCAENLYSQELDHWFKTPAGVAVGQAFVRELRRVEEFLHGDSLLQLGQCGANTWLNELNYRHKWVVHSGLHTPAECHASMLALPIASYQLDCVIAPLILDFFAQESTVLDEIDRVLKPMGHVIFFGVNAWSLWRFALKTYNHSYYSSLSLKHSLRLRGYRQCFWSEFYFIPPVNNAWIIRKLAFLNEMGKFLWPCPPGFYCLILQKYTPIDFNILNMETNNQLSFA